MSAYPRVLTGVCAAPMAKGQMPAATSAAEPEDEPPVWCAGLCGFRGVP